MSDRRRPEDFLELVERSRRGRLKLYIGFAAGVGKTYRMLEEAHALRRRGVDVVIGLVETHGRSETAALIPELEVVPRRGVAYRGITVEEMDLDAVLARLGDVALLRGELPLEGRHVALDVGLHSARAPRGGEDRVPVEALEALLHALRRQHAAEVVRQDALGRPPEIVHRDHQEGAQQGEREAEGSGGQQESGAQAQGSPSPSRDPTTCRSKSSAS